MGKLLNSGWDLLWMLNVLELSSFPKNIDKLSLVSARCIIV